MKRKTIKAKIAAALSASMVFAMLAPALPAYAASYVEVNHNLNTEATKALYGGYNATIGEVSGKEGLLGFDFTTLNPSIKGWVKNQVLNGNPGEAIGSQVLPFFPSGAFSSTATFNGKVWGDGGFDLSGYEILGYNQAPLRGTVSGFPRSSQIEIPNLSAQGALYYAELGPDGSKFDYVVAHEGNTSSIYVPVSKYDGASTMNSAHTAVLNPATEGIPSSPTGGKEVLTDFQANSKSIPGYTTAAPDVKLYKSGTNTPWAQDSGFDISNDRVAGEIINKDSFITFKYLPDTAVKFKLTVVDNFYNYDPNPTGGVTIGEGSHVNAGELKRSGTPRSVTRTGNKSYYVTEAVNTDGATKALDGSYKLDGMGNIDLNPGAATEYILDPETPVEISYSYPMSADPVGGNNYGKFLNPLGNVIETLVPAKFASNPAGFTPLNIAGVADGCKPEGQMLNQNVTIKYNYIKNPNYYRGITVNYVDDEGNNINNKVMDTLGNVADLPASPGIPTVGTAYKNPTSGSLFIRVDSGAAANYVIPLPKLDTYLAYNTTPRGVPTLEPESTTSWDSNFTPTSGAIAGELALGGAQEWNASNEDLNVASLAGVGANNTLTVIYTRDANSIAVINPITGIGGKLVVPAHINNIGLSVPEHEYGGGTYPSGGAYGAAGLANQPIDDTVSLPRVKNLIAGTYHINVTDNDLPTPVADDGYRFRGWRMSDGSWLMVNSFSDDDPVISAKSLPANTLEQTSTMSAVTLTAVFELDKSRWKNYKLVAGDTHVTFNNGNEAKVLSYDYTTNTARTNIPGSDLNEWIDLSTGAMTVDSGYNLVWYDEDFAPVDLATINLADYRDGYTFTAYGRTSTPTAPYVPEVNPGINQVTGTPYIAVDPISPAAMDVGLHYVVTDRNGVVVSVITGAQLLANGGNISGSILHLGESYRVYSADPAANVTVGAPIPSSSGVSTASREVTIPVTVNLQASEDPANAGRAQIVIDPADPNTQYALLDDTGATVYDFKSPDTGNQVVFSDLDTDRIYTIVPRPLHSSESVSDRKNAGVKTEDVNTGNLGIRATVFPVIIIPPDNAAMPGTTTSITVNGTNKTLADLDSLRFGQRVRIDAEPIDNNGALFKQWRIISGNTGHSNNIEDDPSGRISFTMPRGPVRLQILYDNGINFEPDYYPKRGDFAPNNIGVTYPVGSSGISTPGLYRVRIDQSKVSAEHEALVQEKYTDVYKGEFEFKVVLESSNDGGNTWKVYDGADAPASLNANVYTGALASNRSYSLYKLATGSNAVSNVPGDYDVKGGGSGYNGTFSGDFEQGETYIFGYTSQGNTLRFVRNADMSTVKAIAITPGSKLSDYESEYSSVIPGRGDTFMDGNTGLTWTYVGLSTRADRREDVNRNTLLNSDTTVYLFYTSDADYRGKLVEGLNDSLSKVDGLDAGRYNASDVAKVRAKADEARAILNRPAPNMAFATELAKVLEELNAILNGMGINTRPTPNRPNNNRGGGGGGGGSRRSTGNTERNTIRVGYDGNWQLLNPEDNNLDNRNWVFNLTNGQRVKGWAYLSYTYEGITKSEWYYFNEDGIMSLGWINVSGQWYYLSKSHNGFAGEMVKGWYYDTDGRWYYLDANSGAMQTGWLRLGSDYYYLNTVSMQGGKPLGAMYQNETTPDNYTVDANGVWR